MKVSEETKEGATTWLWSDSALSSKFLWRCILVSVQNLQGNYAWNCISIRWITREFEGHRAGDLFWGNWIRGVAIFMVVNYIRLLLDSENATNLELFVYSLTMVALPHLTCTILHCKATTPLVKDRP